MADTDESRLERMIARLTTQRALLNFIAERVTAIPGPILEIGLGKGRTYTHLRKLFTERGIWAFDFEVHAPAHSQPLAQAVILGDFRQSLKSCWAEIKAAPAFIHADIGTESRKADAALATFIGGVAAEHLRLGGLLLGDRDMSVPGLERMQIPQTALPAGISAWPYFLYRRP